jgi:hypothetical protein
MEDDPALTAFLGARPEDFQFARELFAAGTNFREVKSALQARRVSAEQIARITQELAAELIEPSVVGQLPDDVILNRLRDRGMNPDDAEAMANSAKVAYERRLLRRGLTETRTQRLIYGFLRLLGFRIAPLRTPNRFTPKS